MDTPLPPTKENAAAPQQQKQPPLPQEDQKELLRQRLRQKINNKKSYRTAGNSSSSGGGGGGNRRVETKTQTIDDVLRYLGIEDNQEVKSKLIEEMRSGRITNVQEMSQWLALHAPITAGLRIGGGGASDISSRIVQDITASSAHSASLAVDKIIERAEQQ